MNNDIRELYQEVILDHYKKPRNFRIMDGANRQADGFNPLCGDKVTIYLKVEDGVVLDVSFQGSGCAISVASASLMSEVLKGKTEQEAEEMFQSFHHVVTGKEDGKNLGKLAVLSGVQEFPSRIKCATLSWHTMQAAREQKDEFITTE